MQSTSGARPSRAIIVHGYGASPENHWFGWLAEQLAASGVPTQIVRLPDSDTPAVDAWVETIGEAVGVPDDGTILVGHSLGCISLLRYLISLDDGWSARSLVLVAGFARSLGALRELDPFVEGLRPGVPLDLTPVISVVPRRTVVRSDDDWVVPPAASDHLAELLQAQLVVVPGGGHFLDAEGWTTLPQVIEQL